MPDESCRYCGMKLNSCMICQDCHRTVQQICLYCKQTTSIQYHSKCDDFEAIYYVKPKLSVTN